MDLKPETFERIEAMIPRYPRKRSAAVPVLHAVQEEKGYVPKEAVEWIAERLELEPINVYELVTFYPMFKEEPVGRRQIKVCRTLSCALAGAYGTCRRFEEAFGCKVGETSADGEASIEFVECHADCAEGPVVMVGEELYERVDEAAADRIAEDLKKR